MNTSRSIELTPLSVDNVAMAARIHCVSWMARYHNVLPAEYVERHSPEWFAQKWQGLLEEHQNGAGTSLLASSNGVFVGVIRVGPLQREAAQTLASPTTGEVSRLYVVPWMQGTGAGRALLEAGEAWLASHEFTDGNLFVSSPNSQQLGFYESRGWKPAGTTTEDYAGTPVSVLRMNKKLEVPSACLV